MANDKVKHEDKPPGSTSPLQWIKDIPVERNEAANFGGTVDNGNAAGADLTMPCATMPFSLFPWGDMHESPDPYAKEMPMAGNNLMTDLTPVINSQIPMFDHHSVYGKGYTPILEGNKTELSQCHTLDYSVLPDDTVNVASDVNLLQMPQGEVNSNAGRPQLIRDFVTDGGTSVLSHTLDGVEIVTNNNFMISEVEEDCPETLDGCFLTLGIGRKTEDLSKSNILGRNIVDNFERVVLPQSNTFHSLKGDRSSLNPCSDVAAGVSCLQNNVGEFNLIENNTPQVPKQDHFLLPGDRNVCLGVEGNWDAISAYIDPNNGLQGYTAVSSLNPCSDVAAGLSCLQNNVGEFNLIANNTPQVPTQDNLLPPGNRNVCLGVEGNWDARSAYIDPSNGLQRYTAVSSLNPCSDIAAGLSCLQNYVGEFNMITNNTPQVDKQHHFLMPGNMNVCPVDEGNWDARFVYNYPKNSLQGYPAVSSLNPCSDVAAGFSCLQKNMAEFNLIGNNTPQVDNQHHFLMPRNGNVRLGVEGNWDARPAYIDSNNGLQGCPAVPLIPVGSSLAGLHDSGSSRASGLPLSSSLSMSMSTNTCTCLPVSSQSQRHHIETTRNLFSDSSMVFPPIGVTRSISLHDHSGKPFTANEGIAAQDSERGNVPGEFRFSQLASNYCQPQVFGAVRSSTDLSGSMMTGEEITVTKLNTTAQDSSAFVGTSLKRGAEKPPTATFQAQRIKTRTKSSAGPSASTPFLNVSSPQNLSKATSFTVLAPTAPSLPHQARSITSLPSLSQTNWSQPPQAKGTALLPPLSQTAPSLPPQAKSTPFPTLSQNTFSLPTQVRSSALLAPLSQTAPSLPSQAKTTTSLPPLYQTASFLPPKAKSTSSTSLPSLLQTAPSLPHLPQTAPPLSSQSRTAPPMSFQSRTAPPMSFQPQTAPPLPSQPRTAPLPSRPRTAPPISFQPRTAPPLPSQPRTAPFPSRLRTAPPISFQPRTAPPLPSQPWTAPTLPSHARTASPISFPPRTAPPLPSQPRTAPPISFQSWTAPPLPSQPQTAPPLPSQPRTAPTLLRNSWTASPLPPNSQTYSSLPFSQKISPSLPPQHQTASAFHIKWQGVRQTQPIGHKCLICKRDLSFTPEGPVSLPTLAPVVAILPCGHTFHDHCLRLITPEDQVKSPPCIPCAIGDS